MVLRESNKKFNVPAVCIDCGVVSVVFDMRPVITQAATRHLFQPLLVRVARPSALLISSLGNQLNGEKQHSRQLVIALHTHYTRNNRSFNYYLSFCNINVIAKRLITYMFTYLLYFTAVQRLT